MKKIKYRLDRKSRNCNKTKLQISLEFFQSFRGAVLYITTNTFIVIIIIVFVFNRNTQRQHTFTRVFTF